jgi:hypothetical protein
VIRFSDVGAIVIISSALLYISKFYLTFRSAGKGSMAGEDGEGRLAWEEVKGLDVAAI